MVGPLDKLQHIVLGAEPMSEQLRETIRGLAHAAGADPRLKIYETLGMTEMKWWFGECNEHSGLHLNPRILLLGAAASPDARAGARG